SEPPRPRDASRRSYRVQPRDRAGRERTTRWSRPPASRMSTRRCAPHRFPSPSCRSACVSGSLPGALEDREITDQRQMIGELDRRDLESIYLDLRTVQNEIKL